MSGCPHAEAQDCPLYHAAHAANAGGCDDGQLTPDTCAADRGLDYEGAVQRLRVTHPEIVAHCEWNADLRRRQGQRRRNMVASGVH